MPYTTKATPKSQCLVVQCTVAHKNNTKKYLQLFSQLLSCQVTITVTIAYREKLFLHVPFFPIIQKHQLQLHKELPNDLVLLPSYNYNYMKHSHEIVYVRISCTMVLDDILDEDLLAGWMALAACLLDGLNCLACKNGWFLLSPFLAC